MFADPGVLRLDAALHPLEMATREVQKPALRPVSQKTSRFCPSCRDSKWMDGWREAVFRYDPDDKGGYKPRVELFRFPPHSWVYDLELRGPDLYVLTMNALYVLPDGTIKTEGLKPKRLLWGVPAGHVHQCFHGLA